MATQTPQQLKRQLGPWGATWLGLGSIIGTGAFVSLGLGAEAAGGWVVLAVVLAGGVAICNAMSAAQLAAAFPVGGGTYEYGYRVLNPLLGFTAGWMFLVAKSASAATAAIGLGSYLASLLNLGQAWMPVGLGAGAIVVLTLLILSGLRRTSFVNTIIVIITLASLIILAIAGLAGGPAIDFGRLVSAPADQDGSLIQALLTATALMFVAYTGYGRIATMGEEISNPAVNIPRAVVLTVILSIAVYTLVSVSFILPFGAESFSQWTQSGAAPLMELAKASWPPGIWIAVLGAVTAMLGVLLNLILGLSRVWMAMGRRGDMPSPLATLRGQSPTPVIAILLASAIVLAMTLIGDIGLTWSFSAFTVLIYYGITNGAALMLPSESKLYPRWISLLGLLACVALAAMVEPAVILVGLGVIAVGCLWFLLRRTLERRHR